MGDFWLGKMLLGVSSSMARLGVLCVSEARGLLPIHFACHLLCHKVCCGEGGGGGGGGGGGWMRVGAARG
jgi:hypothetical protein